MNAKKFSGLDGRPVIVNLSAVDCIRPHIDSEGKEQFVRIFFASSSSYVDVADKFSEIEESLFIRKRN